MRARWPALPATGRLEAVVVVAELPAATAAALLPAGLELLPQSLTAAGRQPLVLLLGEHDRVGVGGLPFGLRYRELVVALPFVRPRGGPAGPFCHLPILLLDRRLPTVLGRWLYGFAKQRATIRCTGERFTVARRADQAPLLSARFAPPVDRAAAPPIDLERIRPLLEQPLISGRPGGPWRYARFDFALARARLAATEAEIMVHAGLLPGLPAGPIRVTSALRLQTAWTLMRHRVNSAPQGSAGHGRG